MDNKLKHLLKYIEQNIGSYTIDDDDLCFYEHTLEDSFGEVYVEIGEVSIGLSKHFGEYSISISNSGSSIFEVDYCKNVTIVKIWETILNEYFNRMYQEYSVNKEVDFYEIFKLD